MARCTALISTYRELAKSGIVALVLISVLGGYLIGQSAELSTDWTRMVITLFGVLFLASGSSALNQLQEVEIDARMPRTAKRPLPSGRISRMHATLFVLASVSAGLGLLGLIGTGPLLLGLAALIFYNGLYTLWWKRHWAFAAVPGAIPGAIPILIGYAAAAGSILNPAGIYLFFILFFWQMPHFWVLALRFRDDYAAGEIPTLPVAKGTGVTVAQIVIWCLAFVALAFMAPLFLRVRGIYLVTTLVISIKLLWELKGFAAHPESRSWLRFFLWVNFSLIGYIAAAVVDLWSIFAVPIWVR